MSRQITAFRLLVERPIAKRFGQATVGMKAGRIALHLKSVLAAAIINPSFLLPSISSGRALSLQLGKLGGNQRPVLLAVYCNDSQDRDSLRRLLLALTSEVAGLMGGPVLPDASSVLRAVLAEWLSISVLNRPDEPEKQARSKPKSRSVSRQKPWSVKSSRPSLTSSKPPIRFRTPYGWTRGEGNALPHPDYPDVSAVPVNWRPGQKGRPPRGATQGEDGSWMLPEGFRLIEGRVHMPLALFREAVSQRKAKRKANKHRRRRSTKAVLRGVRPKEPAGEATLPPRQTPELPETSSLRMQTEPSSPNEGETPEEGNSTEPSGEPP